MRVVCAKTGKNTFGTVGQAGRAAVAMQTKHGAPARPYRCQFCGFFHLTTHRWHRPEDRR